MKFKMSGGWWLFIITAIYLIAEIIAIAVYHLGGDKNLTTFYIQLIWLFVLSLPLWINPIARFCNMKVLWKK